MMEKAEGSQKSKKDLQNSTSNPPWIELLDSLIEEIIEKLPLVDYIRFGVICKRWHWIQKEHRVRYSPKPPPIAPSVFLVNYKYSWTESNWEDVKDLVFLLPFEQKKYHLPLKYSSPKRIYDSCCGWIFTYSNHFPSALHHYYIYNPVTGVTIDLPVSYQHFQILDGSMSAPPTDPNCCIIISIIDEIFVLCLRDLVWVKVQYNDDLIFGWFVYLNGKFYRTSVCKEKTLSIVDPFLPKPVEEILKLDNKEMIENDEFDEKDEKDEKLTVIDGELFLVVAVYFRGGLKTKRFDVFRVNFATRKWIRVTSLGDYFILFSDNVMSLRVNSVEGFKKNIIYFSKKFNLDDGPDHQGMMRFIVSWSTFNMDSQEIAEESSFFYDKDQYDLRRTLKLFWFFPTI